MNLSGGGSLRFFVKCHRKNSVFSALKNKAFLAISIVFDDDVMVG